MMKYEFFFWNFFFMINFVRFSMIQRLRTDYKSYYLMRMMSLNSLSQKENYKRLRRKSLAKMMLTMKNLTILMPMNMRMRLILMRVFPSTFLPVLSAFSFSLFHSFSNSFRFDGDQFREYCMYFNQNYHNNFHLIYILVGW